MDFKTAQKLTCWIPTKRLRIALRTKLINFVKTIEVNIEVNKIRKKFPELEEKLKEKIKEKEKIKIAFFTLSDTAFQTNRVYEQMLKSDIFEPYIVVIPDMAFKEEDMFAILDKTYKVISEKYKNVYSSYDKEKKEFIDFSSQWDIIFYNNIYDSKTNYLYSIEYNSKKGILSCYTDYGYTISNWLITLYKNIEHNVLWKIFALESFEYKNLQKNIIDKNSVILSGYCKMDKLINVQKKKRERKKIIIAIHHTIESDGDLQLSNFIKYSDFFLDLPKRYPEIDFVFRPHPLLFLKLTKNEQWGKEKAEEYIKKLTQNPNVEYQNGGDYFDTFINSDGLIHDCGSFSAEYLYTEHPCCFMLKDEALNNKNSNEFHKSCIDKHYKAYSKQDIINFIEEVIIKGNDPKKAERKAFFEKTLKLNYPNSSDFIINQLKKELKID